MNQIIAILNHIYACICSIGFFANFLALFVFSRKKFQTTIFTTYFRILCLFDILTLLARIDYFLTANNVIFFAKF